MRLFILLKLILFSLDFIQTITSEGISNSNLNVTNIEIFEKTNEKRKVKVEFVLYTQQNPKEGQVIPILNQNSLGKSYFNPKNPTRFIIHGWLNNQKSKVNVLIRNAYLGRGNFNVFVVDWGSIAQFPNYIDAKNKVDEVGKKVSEFIEFIHEYGKMSFDNLYVIGHSLGAHVAGFSGKYLTKGKINTIFGLDPALPSFTYNLPEKRLAVTDALYVETIHTNGDKLGFFDPIGTASFYPNGGKKQPGCSKVEASGTCSHLRSFEYFAESISLQNKFNAIQCKNLNDLKNGNCTSDKYSKFKMGGEPSNCRKANGIYYLETNSKAPFGKGLKKK